MSEVEVKQTNQTETKKKPEIKICCACPETKKARDECIFENGEENCKEYIDKHMECLRDLGFDV